MTNEKREIVVIDGQGGGIGRWAGHCGRHPGGDEAEEDDPRPHK